VSLAAALLALAAGMALAGEQVIFFDDFEATPVGTLPANWQIIYSGRAGEQKVTQDVAYSGTRSFQLWGWPGWSALVIRNFSSTSPLLGYEFAIQVSASNSGAANGDHPGFYCHRCENYWGTYYALTQFNHPYLEVRSETEIPIGTWVPGTWYRVRALLDRTLRTYAVWLDGEQVAEGLPIWYLHPDWIQALGLVAAHAGVKVYYDDVKVFVPGPEEVSGILEGEIAALVDGGALTGGLGTALTAKLDNTLDKLARGQTASAVAMLQAFVSQVGDLVADGVLTPAQGQRLIELANVMLAGAQA
jgi:hypothetical protein